MLLKKLLGMLTVQRREQRRAELQRDLIRHEAKIGGQLFGPVPADARREFFCLDEHTWVWHEEWTDQNGQHQYVTTRYDVHPRGILKAQNGQAYQPVTAAEALNLNRAAQIYGQRVKAELYGAVA